VQRGELAATRARPDRQHGEISDDKLDAFHVGSHRPVVWALRAQRGRARPRSSRLAGGVRERKTPWCARHLLSQPRGTECWKLDEVPEPKAGPGKVKVRVARFALNPIRSPPPVAAARAQDHVAPRSGGATCARHVSAAGRRRLHGGAAATERALNPGISSGNAARVLAGRDTFCPEFACGRDAAGGGCAEKVVVQAANGAGHRARSGAARPDADMAVDAYSVITEWQSLVEREVVRPGETVLVLAAGVGRGGTAANRSPSCSRARGSPTRRKTTSIARASALAPDDRDKLPGHRAGAEVKRPDRSQRRRRRRRGTSARHLVAKSVVAWARGRRHRHCGRPTASSRRSTCARLLAQAGRSGSTLASKASCTRSWRWCRGTAAPGRGPLLPLADRRCRPGLPRGRAVCGKVVLVP